MDEFTKFRQSKTGGDPDGQIARPETALEMALNLCTEEAIQASPGANPIAHTIALVLTAEGHLAIFSTGWSTLEARLAMLEGAMNVTIAKEEEISSPN